MALTINLPNAIEQNLRQAAAESGISLDGYIVQLLSKVKPKSNKNKALSEAELLEKITLDISESEWKTYRQLVQLRREENLTDEQYAQLLALGEKIEAAGVKRVGYLVQLSILREISLDALMQQLDIQPVEV
jgi:hypothetical protein